MNINELDLNNTFLVVRFWMLNVMWNSVSLISTQGLLIHTSNLPLLSSHWDVRCHLSGELNSSSSCCNVRD